MYISKAVVVSVLSAEIARIESPVATFGVNGRALGKAAEGAHWGPSVGTDGDRKSIKPRNYTYVFLLNSSGDSRIVCRPLSFSRTAVVESRVYRQMTLWRTFLFSHFLLDSEFFEHRYTFLKHVPGRSGVEE